MLFLEGLWFCNDVYLIILLIWIEYWASIGGNGITITSATGVWNHRLHVGSTSNILLAEMGIHFWTFSTRLHIIFLPFLLTKYQRVLCSALLLFSGFYSASFDSIAQNENNKLNILSNLVTTCKSIVCESN